MTRLFPSTLVLSALILIVGAPGVDWVYEASGGGRTPSAALVYLLYYLGISCFVYWVAYQPAGSGIGFTSRIHHRLSLLLFPFMVFGEICRGAVIGMFNLPPTFGSSYRFYLYGAFFVWWVIPVEWWDVWHRVFVGEQPKRTPTAIRDIFPAFDSQPDYELFFCVMGGVVFYVLNGFLSGVW